MYKMIRSSEPLQLCMPKLQSEYNTENVELLSGGNKTCHCPPKAPKRELGG